MTDMCDGGAHIKPSHCCVMEAFLVECEPEEVDRNHPMTKFFFCNLQNELQKLHFLQSSPIKLGEYEYKLNDLLNTTNFHTIPTNYDDCNTNTNINKLSKTSTKSCSNSTPTQSFDRSNTVSSPNIDLLCKYYLQNNNPCDYNSSR